MSRLDVIRCKLGNPTRRDPSGVSFSFFYFPSSLYFFYRRDASADSSFFMPGGERLPRKPRRGCAYGRCPRLAEEGDIYCAEHRKLFQREEWKRYDQQDRDPESNKRYGRSWREIRYRYAKAHPYCEKCFSEGRMVPLDEVHHKIPLSRGGTNDPDNLMSLCQSCHTKIHLELGDRKPRKAPQGG